MSLLGIDLGTSGVKALLIDEEGRAVASHTVEYPLLTPKPQWAEQEPEEWQAATLEALGALGRDRLANVKAIGLSGQMHGSVFLDSAGEVVRPALLWCDQRTAAECDWIVEKVGWGALLAETLNPPLTGFTAGKIVWLRNHEPENYARARHVLLPKDFIRYKLTGELATDVSDASGTCLFNVPNRDWSQTVLNALDLPLDWFPKAYESPQPTGQISRTVAESTGLSVGTMVVAGAGDQAAGAVGTGIVETGTASCSIGTSGVAFAMLESPVPDPGHRTHVFCHAVPGAWHSMGVMLMAGGSLRWFRDAFHPGRSYADLAELAGQAPPGCDGLVFLPYLAGERAPHPDPHARGVFFGATLSHGAAHFARAVFEGIAFGLADLFDLLGATGATMSAVRATGGGAQSRFWMKMLADLLGRPIETLEQEEGPAFGAALLAGVGSGVWPSVEAACQATVRTKSRIEPGESLYGDARSLYTRLYPALKELFKP